MVLESRHLVGLFLLMVVISGVVFTLGYVLGRNQQTVQARVAASGIRQPSGGAGDSGEASQVPGAPPLADSAAGSVRSDWAFYGAAEQKKTGDQLEKLAKSESAVNKLTTSRPPASELSSGRGKALLHAPLVPRGAIVLQVAAMTREDEALVLAEALQKKKFPAFVLTPGADQYYRIQVGPYTDTRSAEIARRGLEHEGFKAIFRR